MILLEHIDITKAIFGDKNRSKQLQNKYKKKACKHIATSNKRIKNSTALKM